VAENIKQSLSAMMDGEASEIELHRLLRQVGQDDLEKSWISYQQIRSVLRNEPLYTAQMHLELHRNINESVENDTEFEVNTKPFRSTGRYLKPLGGLAVAASLAVVGFIGINQYLTDGNGSVEQLVEAEQIIESEAKPVDLEDPVSGQSMEETQLVENQAVDGSVLDPIIESDLQALPPEKQKRLREYLLRHDKRFGSQTRVVTYKKPKAK
jgi:sigma-E factor negative regulatory protein RseA